MFERFACIALVTICAGAAHAAPLCGPGATDDTLRDLPASLVGKAKDLFGLAMPDDLVRRTTVTRCAGGKLLMCTEGANLPCGKANMSKSSAGATAWCRANPHAAIVPAFATGHDTIYAWHCDNGEAEAGKPVQAVDPRGFFARYWRQAD